MALLDQQFRLPDGRLLGYNQYGPPGGRPVFYLHGSPSSRVEPTLFASEELLAAQNTCLIAADRPGMGLSDFQPNRRILDWPQDVLALADHLGMERFSILAYSLGGPYGLACAFAIPERLHRIGILSGAALFTEPDLMGNINPGTRRYLNLPRENPWAARGFLWMMGAILRIAPRQFVANAAGMLPEPDSQVIADPDVQAGFITMVREALRQGSRGAFHESLLTISEWGFRLQDIQPPVHLWHGEMDQNIPVEMARYLAGVLPASELEIFHAEGHLSLFKTYAGAVFAALIE